MYNPFKKSEEKCTDDVQKEEKNEPETQARSLLNFDLDFPPPSSGKESSRKGRG
jgi:hypothetical protein